jgi:hypothetical protein
MPDDRPRTGRLPHNPVALAAAKAHRFGATRPPASLNRSLLDFVPGDYGNTTKPICTFVSMTNVARGIVYLNEGADNLDVDPAKPSAGFAAAIGCANTDAAIAATDGMNMLDVVAWQDKNGFDIGPQRLVGISGTVATNRIALANAMNRLGLVWGGIQLFARDMDDTGPSSILDVVEGRDDGALVALHAVPFWTYVSLADDGNAWFGTWGYWQACTQRWIEKRTEEAHAWVYRQLANPEGSFYSGLTADGLVAEMSDEI